MDLLDRRLGDLAARRRAQRALDAATPWTTAALLLAAVAIAIVRLAAPAAAPAVPWLAAIAACAGVPAAIAAARAREARAAIAGRLDLALDAHGLAMALAAATPAERDAEWSSRLRLPLEAWRPPAIALRALKPTALAALFVAGAAALPQLTPRAATTSAVDALFAPLAARVDAASEARLLPPDQADEPRRRLDELRAHAAAQGMDQATWDGLDRIAADLDTATAAATRRLAAALVAADAAGDARRGDAGAATAKAIAALGDLAAQAPGLVPTFPAGAEQEALAKALAEAARAEAATPEQLLALARAGLQAAGEAGLDDDQRRALAKRLAEELAAMRARLARLGPVPDQNWRDLLDQMRDQNGDSDPAGGHKPLDRVPRERFTDGAVAGLPPGARLNADGSVTLAEQSRSADLDDAALRSAVRAAARAFDPAAADARRADVAPRHRAVVERYFASDAQPAP